MAGRIAGEHHKRVLDRYAQPCIEKMRVAARECGYALAVHGTLAFDIDVVAIPWIDEASPADTLIDRLRAACSEITGLPTHYWGMPCENPELTVGDNADKMLLEMGKRPYEERPHGRTAWSWQLGGGAYVDCSVMPRVAA